MVFLSLHFKKYDWRFVFCNFIVVDCNLTALSRATLKISPSVTNGFYFSSEYFIPSSFPCPPLCTLPIWAFKASVNFASLFSHTGFSFAGLPSPVGTL